MNDHLISENITLRPVTGEDTENILKWRNCDFVRKNFLYQKPVTIADHQTWLRERVATGQVAQFVIEIPEPVGSVYLRDIDHERGEAEYGIFIGEESAAGRGIGSKVCRMTVNYAKEELKLKRLTLRLFSDNIAARKSYENAGFTLIKGKEESVYSEFEGKEKTVIFMEIRL